MLGLRCGKGCSGLGAAKVGICRALRSQNTDSVDRFQVRGSLALPCPGDRDEGDCSDCHLDGGRDSEKGKAESGGKAMGSP